MNQRLMESTQRIVPKACADLFGSIGFPAAQRPAADLKRVLAQPDDHAAGVIDFAGEAMTGKIVLLSSFDFFASSRPSAGHGRKLSRDSAADWILVRDWSMELSNQLLGRIKNQLYTLGIVVEQKVPKAVSGHSLLVTVRGRKSAQRVFATREHEVHVWFEFALAETVTQRASLAPIPEGQVVFF